MSDNQEKTQDEIDAEKQLLIDILSFTPCKVNLYVGGYGGESYFVRSSPEAYRYFKDNNITLDMFDDWDNELKIPEHLQPYPPGSPYDGDLVIGASGASVDDGCVLRVETENGEELFESTLDISDLDEHNVEYVEEEEFYPDWDCKRGDVLVWVGYGEKGSLYGGPINLNSPFDKSKLKISYRDVDGWTILDSIEYDGELIDNDDYSTTGKWTDRKWIIVGGEAALEERSQWFKRDAKPARKGMYEVRSEIDGTVTTNVWTGRKWENSSHPFIEWRGLTKEFVSSEE